MRGTQSLRARALAVAVSAVMSFGTAMLSQAISDHMSLPAPAAVIQCWPASCSQDDLVQLHQAMAAAQRAREITTTPPHLSPGPTPSPQPPPAPPSVGGGGPLTPDQVGQYWLAAGGSPAAEQTAECIAWHESGDNPDAISRTSDVGLWQINASHMGTGSIPSTWSAFVTYEENPANNAAEAVALSGGGSNWSAWTTAPDCGV